MEIPRWSTSSSKLYSSTVPSLHWCFTSNNRFLWGISYKYMIAFGPLPYTVWVQTMPEHTQLSKHDLCVAFPELSFLHVYPCGAVEATCAHYAPSWCKQAFCSYKQLCACVANPTRGRLLSQCVSICQCSSQGLMRKGGKEEIKNSWLSL